MSQQIELNENKMGVMSVNKLLVSMSLPMIISMLVQALYNIVDSAFVAQISENALTAVSLAFPVQNLMIAICAGTGVGVNALLSRALGEKNSVIANKIADNGVFLALLSYALFAIFGILGAEKFFAIQTTNTEIIAYGATYLRICCCASFGLCGQFIFEKLLQSTGKTLYTMFTQGLGAIINIVLDPILIFGLFGFPKLGVAGAAIATVIGQIIAFLFAMYLNHHKNHDIQLQLKGFKPCAVTIKRIYAIGVPSIIMQSIASIMTFGLNKILAGFSSTAIAVFGVYFKLQSIAFMPVFGLNNGMIPIIAYNYGAGKRDRIKKTITLSIFYAVSIMLIFFTVIQLFTAPLLNIFNASEEMLAIGVPALRTISLSFIFAGFCIIVSSVFQALGEGIQSLVISVVRQLVILLPVAYLFAQTGVLNYVWFAFPIAEIFAVIMSVTLFIRTNNKIIKRIGNN